MVVVGGRVERVGGWGGQSATMHSGLIRRRRLFTYLQSKDRAISLDEAPEASQLQHLFFLLIAAWVFFFFFF